MAVASPVAAHQDDVYEFSGSGWGHSIGMSQYGAYGQALEEATYDEKGALVAIKDELVTAPIRYSQPMLVDQLSYLYENLQRADQRPSRDAIDRWGKLNEELQSLLSRLEQATGTTD